MYLNFSNFWGRTSAGGGQALVQKRGQVSDGGGLAKFSPDGGTPCPPQEKNPVKGYFPVLNTITFHQMTQGQGLLQVCLLQSLYYSLSPYTYSNPRQPKS